MLFRSRPARPRVRPRRAPPRVPPRRRGRRPSPHQRHSLHLRPPSGQPSRLRCRSLLRNPPHGPPRLRRKRHHNPRPPRSRPTPLRGRAPLPRRPPRARYRPPTSRHPTTRFPTTMRRQLATTRTCRWAVSRPFRHPPRRLRRGLRPLASLRRSRRASLVRLRQRPRPSLCPPRSLHPNRLRNSRHLLPASPPRLPQGASRTTFRPT